MCMGVFAAAAVKVPVSCRSDLHGAKIDTLRTMPSLILHVRFFVGQQLLTQDPLEAILVIFGCRALNFFLFESSWKKMKNDTTFVRMRSGDHLGDAKMLKKIHLFAGRVVKRERRKGSSRRQQTAHGAAVYKVARELLRSARSPKRENGGRRYIKHDGTIASPVGSCFCC